MNRFLNDIFSGEYCSDLISSVWYGKDGVIKDNTKYSYDEKGNITKIFENGTEKVRYTYDELSRLIREDNKELNKTFIFSYDNGGNIVEKFETVYTLANTDNIVKETVTAEDIANDKEEYGFSLRKLSKLTKFGYSATGWKDLLLSVDDEGIEYDSLGNPTTYCGSQLKWNYLRNLEKIGDIATYKYNASGIRTSKIVGEAETKFYLNGNKIIAQDDGDNRLIFYYGIDGLAGFSINGVEYTYKKNIQNDITGIYDTNGNQLVKYVYDAWGNHKTFVLYNGNFVDISLNNGYTDDDYQEKVDLAEINPFRYRSYYLDEETGLYYLNSRYYDAELGRFINADSLDNLDKESFNGLNLFAYCLNNPVNLTDSKGTSWWSDFWEKNWDVIVGTIISAVLIIGGILLTIFTAGAGATIGIVMIGAGVGGLIGGIDSKLNGGNYWAGWLGGTVSGIITTGLGLINPIGAFFGGLIGNAVGSLITDSLNGVDLSSKNYWINLTTESIISGLLSIVGWHFGNATDILKSINLKNLFAAITVWAEFAFSYLTDMTNDLFKYIGEIFRNKSVRRA